MANKQSNKWILARFIFPVTLFAGMLAGCNKTNVVVNDPDRITVVIDSLLNENRKLTDSLTVTKERLKDCEQRKAPRPCKQKAKPAPAKPAAEKSADVSIEQNNNSANTVVIGNHNTVNVTNIVGDTVKKKKITIEAYVERTYKFTR